MACLGSRLRQMLELAGADELVARLSGADVDAAVAVATDALYG